MGAIFSFSTWLIVNVLGEAQAVAIAKRESGNLIFYVSDLVLGRFATHFFNIFIVTALFAAVVTFHNNIARYLYLLGRQRLLWAPLGHTRKIAKTPYIASIVQSISALLILALFGTFDQDPYAVVLAVMTGIGTVGLILAQALSAVAIFIFFRRNRVGAHPLRTIAAPLVSCFGFLFILYYAFSRVDLLLGVDMLWALPLAMSVFAVFAGGILFAWWVKRTDPAKFDRIERSLVGP
jgi:amino acid transporter